MAYEHPGGIKKEALLSAIFEPPLFLRYAKRFLRRTDEPERQGACQPKLWFCILRGIDPVEKNPFH